LHIKENALEMLLRTIYKRSQMNLMVNFKGNSAKRHAWASSNVATQNVMTQNVISPIYYILRY
jgi:hypothetical protein